MIIDKIKNTNSIPEMVTLFITINFIVQISYKFGFLANYGNWTLSLFSPIELMMGNLQLIFFYIMIFTGIIHEKAFLTILNTILCITVFPFISVWIYTGNFTIPASSYFAIVIGIVGFILKKVEKDSTIEIFLFVVLLCIAPMIYGFISSKNLPRQNLSLIELKEQETEKWYILEKFSDSFLLVNEKNNSLKIVKIEETRKIHIIK
ncbi:MULTISPECIES: hypothetical protein [Acinetobacter calcoaceticus/baumannii complex]|uniref:hypothetical protein n=1 Tax=Acinetobacter calcoaceticus/baumannii complex TaxID=909768 RepID=UPI000DE77B09|nr:hypothetical protein [Acinetobacter nosocomialis]MCE5997381.1 hypothetical protein [Acinetobacter nosocomialis]MCH2007447.1 hypothetical protein [Acinetobacter nosocomialis]SSV40403.1 Uncharacterised protein [Acinetobacter nosocomialis]